MNLENELKYKVENPIDLDLDDVSWEDKGTKELRHVVRAIIIEGDKLVFVHVDRDDAFGTLSYIETSGGGAEPKEDNREGLKRELKEELGIDVEILAYLGQVRDYYHLINRKNINDYYLVKVTGHGERNLTQDEIKKWHLTDIRLSFAYAESIYKDMVSSKLSLLVSNRELPVLRKAKQVIDKYNLMEGNDE